MRRRSSYDPYRGRSPLRTLLKIVAVVLAVVLVVSVVVLYFLDPYWTYTPDGPRLQNSPGRTRRSPPPLPPPTSSASPLPTIVVETAEPAETPLHAAALSREALWDAAAVQTQVEAAGANAALFDMKGDDGRLGYASALELAQAAGVSDQTAGLNEAIAALKRPRGAVYRGPGILLPG